MRAWIRRSFSNRIFVSMLLVTLLPLLLCDVLMVQLLVVRHEHTVADQAQADLSRAGQQLQQLTDRLEAVTGDLARSTVVHSALRRGGSDSKILYQVLFRSTRDLRDVAEFEIYDSRGTCCYSTGQPGGRLSLRWGILREAGQGTDLSYRSQPDQGLWAARSVRSYDGGILGYVLIRMEPGDFSRLLEGCYRSDCDAALLDSTWRPAYYSRADRQNLEALRRQLLAGEPLTGLGAECSYYALPLAGSGFTLILQQPKAFSAPVMRTIYFTGGVMGVLCLVLCLLVAWLLSRQLARPIHQLDAAMSQIEGGNYRVELESDRCDELGRLTVSFNRMAREYRLNLQRSVQRQRELNEAQMRLMQAQLNPHFLYNTLDSLKWLGVAHQVPQVAALATDLAALLRAAIGRSELVTVAQELELIERYLNIQYIRFADRFTCEIDVDERFQRCILPKLVLQPLVENAIIHGVRDCEEGYIKVWAEQQGTDFLLWVSDNGGGMSPALLEKLNSPDKRLDGNHLGLYNVDRILRLHYGEGYGLDVRSQPGQGCRVGLRLPMIQEGGGKC
ncbi:MAG: histidine kinase [Eubacteriales bacterium]|nr:histidine kinase [Eubacteriales bacterium]